jgi:hypothetical protein
VRTLQKPVLADTAQDSARDATTAGQSEERRGLMPQMVPSEIVRIIDRFFPWAAKTQKPRTGEAKLGDNETGRVSAIIALIDRLPQEVLMLSPQAYAEFIADVEMLRSKARRAAERGSGHPYSGEPVWNLRNALRKCPDAAATAATHELKFLNPEDFREDVRRDLSEAYQALNEARWKAATVLAGAVIEALLVWRLSKVPTPARQTAVAAAFPNPKKQPAAILEDWHLGQLIGVAAAVPMLLKPGTVTQIRLAQDYRNLIHPGAALRRKELCGKDTALGALSGVERVIQDVCELEQKGGT